LGSSLLLPNIRSFIEIFSSITLNVTLIFLILVKQQQTETRKVKNFLPHFEIVLTLRPVTLLVIVILIIQLPTG
jgi:hypothetical protein